MKSLLTIFAIFLTTSLFSQTSQSVEWYSNGHLKQTETQIEDITLLCKYYPNGKKQFEGAINSLGMEVGIITIYNDKGQIEKQYVADNKIALVENAKSTN